MWKQKNPATLSYRQLHQKNDEDNNEGRQSRKHHTVADLLRLGVSAIVLYHGVYLISNDKSLKYHPLSPPTTCTQRIFQAEWSEEESAIFNVNSGNQGIINSDLIQGNTYPVGDINNLKHWYHENMENKNHNQSIDLFIFNGEERRQSIEVLGDKCLPHFLKNDEFESRPHSNNALEENVVLEKYDEIGKWAQVYKMNGEKELYTTLVKIQLELWKFCIIGSGYASTFVANSGLYFLDSIEEAFDFGGNMNYVLFLQNWNKTTSKTSTTTTSSSGHTSWGFVSSSVISLRTKVGRDVAKNIVQSIVSSPHTKLSAVDSGEWLSNELFQLTVDAIQVDPTKFVSLESQCHGLHEKSNNMKLKKYQRNKGMCTRESKSPCCEVKNDLGNVAFFIQHPMIEVNIPEDIDNSFISAVSTITLGKGNQKGGRSKVDYPKTPRAFDLFLENDCLPSWECHICFIKSTISNVSSCEMCSKECKCYCQNICRVRPKKRRMEKDVLVKPPLIRKEQSRLIPRVIHQTYFEPVTLENNYTHFSKLVESWKQSGWEYYFYDDESSAKFLQNHFPPEVLEAYNSILPGAYKADLFRLCVLLICGGIYSDVDVELTSDLDSLLDDDIGFIIPVDEPGRDNGNGSCMWNGFIAAAPGHPFIAKALEIIVNQIRNRFTSVDIDDMLCPGVALDHAHSWDLLFLTGPCVLGGAINSVLNKHMQTQINPGILDTSENVNVSIPGRSIILAQNKNDMGWHRFTWIEKNIIVAGTDMPDYEDRVHQNQKHYSDKPEAIEMSLFGTKNIYKDTVAKDEDIRIIVSSL